MVNMVVAFVIGFLLGALGMFAYLNDFYKKMGGR